MQYVYTKATLLSMLAIRLSAEIEQRLERLAKKTGRTKTFYAREAILEYLEDMGRITISPSRCCRTPAASTAATRSSVSWDYKFTERALKQLKKLGHPGRQRIIEFLDEHVFGTDDPRRQGKALSRELRGLWRYRVGDYRIVCQLGDEVLIVLVVRVGHRKDVYG